MRVVDSVFIVSTDREEYSINDIINTIEWSCRDRTYFIIVVNQGGAIIQDSYINCHVMSSAISRNIDSGYHKSAGLCWLANSGIIYKQVFMMSDNCMITDLDIDQVLSEYIKQDYIGWLGIQRECEIPRDNWNMFLTEAQANNIYGYTCKKMPTTINSDFIILSARLSAAICKQDLFLPSNTLMTKISYGTYISWISHILGFTNVLWGSEARPLPPLYVGDPKVTFSVPPFNFKKISVFSPVRNVAEYNELQLREIYKKARGVDSLNIEKSVPLFTSYSEVVR